MWVLFFNCWSNSVPTIFTLPSITYRLSPKGTGVVSFPFQPSFLAYSAHVCMMHVHLNILQCQVLMQAYLMLKLGMDNPGDHTLR